MYVYTQPLSTNVRKKNHCGAISNEIPRLWTLSHKRDSPFTVQITTSSTVFVPL